MQYLKKLNDIALLRTENESYNYLKDYNPMFL